MHCSRKQRIFETNKIKIVGQKTLNITKLQLKSLIVKNHLTLYYFLEGK